MHSTRRLYVATASTVAQSRKLYVNKVNIPTHSRRTFGFKGWKRKHDKFKNNNESEDPKFSWKQVFLQWGLGVYVTTPLIAIVQGSLLLNDYRVNYADAPRPLMPARGVAVAVEDETSASKKAISSWIFHPFSSSSNHPHGNERALRLLVVGDSLAAGVGMSKSGVPILPESIARELSKAMGGRAVYWTCVGTPGVSAAQIVKDIEEIEPYDPDPKGRQLERIVKEFQNRRRRWQHRHDHGKDTDLMTDLETIQKKEPMNAFGQWWRQMRQQDNMNPDTIASTTRKVVYDWWMQSSIRNTYQYRRQLVEEDISVIKDIFQPLPQLDDEEDDYFYDYYLENLPVDESSNKVQSRPGNEKRLPLLRKGSLFRRSSVIPEAAAEYDIAVVLTGLNDVKEAFLPHMNSSDTPNDRRLESSLRNVLGALNEKMKGNMDLEGNAVGNNRSDRSLDTSDESVRQRKNIQHPLVVVPELPVAPLEIFRLVPLCWFLVPIFRAMENNKRFLASCFPDNVVFVHQPDLQWWTDDEMGIGSIRENIKQEQLLLRVTDSVRSARERIEDLMKKYYDSKEEELASKGNSVQNALTSVKNPSDLVSVDKMHPNDEGYELWGRHIAGAIIDHWNREATIHDKENV